MAIKGKDFVLEVERNSVFVPICYATDCIISIDAEAKEISGNTTQWRDYIGGYVGYTLSVPGLVMWAEDMNFVQLESYITNRTRVRWRAGDSLPSGVVHSGTVLLTNLTLTSQMRDAVKFDMSAVGCGPKETGLLPTSSTVYLADENKVRLPGCPNPYPVSVYWYSADGNGPGELIGIAINNDAVVQLLNEFAGNEYYEFEPGTTGCDFNLTTDWDAPFIPDVIFAEATPGLVLAPDQENNIVLSPDQDNDEALSPGYA